MLNSYSLSAGKRIHGCRPNNNSLRLQWFIPREMRCRRHQTIMASRDMQGHMSDKSLANDGYFWVLSTELTYTNQPLVRPNSLCMGKWDMAIICLEWCQILSVQYLAKQLSCWSRYIWLQECVVKWRVLSFAAIVKLSRTRWLYERALPLTLGDTTLFVDNWLQISSYPYEVSPIAIVSQYKHITMMM